MIYCTVRIQYSHSLFLKAYMFETMLTGPRINADVVTS
jgi:hypothetical protein